MIMSKINGRYNLIAKNENEKEFVQNLSQIAMVLGEDLDSKEDTMYIIGVEEKVRDQPSC